VQDDNGHALVCQEWLYTLDRFLCPIQGGASIRLPRGPLIRLQSIQYVDAAGVTQTLDSAEYTVDTFDDPACIYPAYQKVWPQTLPVKNAVQIRYLVGYATPCTANVGANTLTLLGRTATVGDTVSFTNSGGRLPLPLVPRQAYLVIVASGNNITLSDVTLTDAGEGLHFIGEIPPELLSATRLLCGHLYENREATASGQPIVTVPIAYQSLVMQKPIVRII
jgi:hypothetical protein